MTTWKAKHTDLIARFGIAQNYIHTLQSALFDCLSGRSKFLCRTAGAYTSEFGSMWYQMQDGTVLCVDHDSEQVSTFKDINEARTFYATLGAAHNVAAYQRLLEVVA